MIETWTGYNFHSNAVGQHKLIIGPRGHCLKPFPLLFPDDRLADIWCVILQQAVRCPHNRWNDREESYSCLKEKSHAARRYRHESRAAYHSPVTTRHTPAYNVNVNLLLLLSLTIGMDVHE